MTNELLIIEGTVEKLIYTNSINGYTVAEIATESELVTATGAMPYLSEGESVKLSGDWISHPSFGRQFNVATYEKTLPATRDSILRYLQSGVIKGIGPATALRIVEKFGDDALDVCENHPDWLTDIKGITHEKAKLIGEAFSAQSGLRSIIMFCKEFFGISTAMRMYKRWGRGAIEIVGANPYILCDEIYGVSFEKADTFAKAKGIKDDAPERICAALKFILRHNAFQNGHTYIPENKLCEVCKNLVATSSENIKNALELCIQSGDVHRVPSLDREAIYLDKYYKAEKYTAQKLFEMASFRRYIKT